MTDDGNTKKLSKYFICAAAISVFAALLRFLPMSAEFQYDELWTLFNFTGLENSRILTDLSLPNNHPINTLILKWISQFSTDLYALRLGVFFSGILVVFLSAKCAAKLTGNSLIAFAAAGFFTAVSASLILYSGIARGYIYQCAGLLVCASGLLECGKERKNVKSFIRRYYPELLIVAGGIISIISIPTAVMFLLPLALAFLIFAPAERKKSLPVWISAGALGIFACIYYLIVFKDLRTAQVWGEKIGSFSQFAKFILDTIPPLLPVPLGIAVLLGMIFNRKYAVAFMLTLLPLITAIFTNAGQVRVYLILAVAYAVLAACGIDEICRSQLTGAKFIAVMLGVSPLLWSYDPAFQPEQPSVLWSNAIKATGDDVLPILRCSSGFPLAANTPDSSGQFRSRAAAPDKKSLLLLDIPNGTINGADKNFAEKSFALDFSGTLHPATGGFLYQLTPLPRQELVNGAVIMGVFAGNNQEVQHLQNELAKMKQSLILNIFISNPRLEDIDRRVIRCFVCRYETGISLPDECELFLISGSAK